ncbi:hypothetical protein HDU91_004945 [Kappamyces sp. JEL0680]|nr:hypothetical protein HDU91_004945 [Kappamyces sp. JEL0680]
MSVRLSSQAQSAVQIRQPLGVGLSRFLQDPYDRTSNQGGIVNLGTAENRLLWPTLQDRLKQELETVSAEDFAYFCVYGTQRLRSTIAAFLNHYLRLGTMLQAEMITVHAGCGSAVANMVQVLVNDGEGIMIPSPFYGGFDYDCLTYTQATIVPVAGKLPDFMPTVQAFDEAFDNAGVPITALILTNPSNPMGTCIPPSLLSSILEWASRKRLQFTSCYALDLPDPQSVHMVWGLSKDFTMNGLRIGCCISRNAPFMKAMHSFAAFTNISSLVDKAVSGLLSDRAWTDSFLASNQRSLALHARKMMQVLDSWSVTYLPPTAAFFIWVDLSRYLATVDAAGELELWEKLMDRGVLISPGCAFHCTTPGWFRIVYAFEWTHLVVGLDRLKAGLDAAKSM